MDKIDKKIYIEDKISSTSCYSDLQIIKLSSNEYQDLVVSGATSPSVLYVVQTDFINAYGQQMKNLDAPVDVNDAATKNYVDTAVQSVSEVAQSKTRVTFRTWTN